MISPPLLDRPERPFGNDITSLSALSGLAINPEFTGLFVRQRSKPCRSYIQGLANEPIATPNLLDNVTDAEHGVAHLPVDQRATAYKW